MNCVNRGRLASEGVFASGDGAGRVSARTMSQSPVGRSRSDFTKVAQGRVPRFGARGSGVEYEAGRQTTLGDQIALSGVGVHSGLPVTLTLHPADASCGIQFLADRPCR